MANLPNGVENLWAPLVAVEELGVDWVVPETIVEDASEDVGVVVPEAVEVAAAEVVEASVAEAEAEAEVEALETGPSSCSTFTFKPVLKTLYALSPPQASLA